MQQAYKWSEMDDLEMESRSSQTKGTSMFDESDLESHDDHIDTLIYRNKSSGEFVTLVQAGFIRKVYSILALQLSLTVLVSLFFMFCKVSNSVTQFEKRCFFFFFLWFHC
jgi:FtsH-binding integral membrane protein